MTNREKALAVMERLGQEIYGKPEVIRDGSVYGAFLLSQEAGGYVMTAVIAFALGVAVTLLCLRLQKRNKQQGNDKDKRI